MCVIMYTEADDRRPTKEMIERAWETNAHGGGVAWRQDGYVHWKKNLKLDDMLELLVSLPVPNVAHFRVASCGGVRPSLTHPFPIDHKTSLALEGRTKGYVLFHNGDWKDWDRAAMKAALNKGIPIPSGKWSDSRAMAWLCSIYGLGFMEFLPTQKGVAFGPDCIEFYTGSGWKDVNGVWCSNDYFLYHGSSHSENNRGWKPMCKHFDCRRKDSLDDDGRCPDHSLNPSNRDGAKGVPPSSDGPFPQPAPIVTLQFAEARHQKGELSKNLLKSIRRLHGKMASGGKKGEKARKELEVVSSRLISSGQRALTSL